MMRKIFSGLLAATVLFSCCNSQVDADFGKVIPLPARIEYDGDGSFVIKERTRVVYDSEDSAMARNADFLAGYIRDGAGLDVRKAPDRKAGKSITLDIDTLIANEEGYILTVGKKGIEIRGGSAKGVFYGIQTLRKALPASTEVRCRVAVPYVRITDEPRFGYRGLHLDVARHYFPVEFVKKYIDLMALHNMNTFHWHLTDDQGWRIEIRQYPELTAKGSVRKETMVRKNVNEFDGTPYGGYYTQDEIRDIVKYAADRNITVIPEIDLPGHMVAALACFPELGCTGGPYEVAGKWGIMPDILCAGNDGSFEFLENVFDEITGLFPSEYIHIGGDEAPRTRWEACPKCQARIKAENLKDDDASSAEDKLQSYFMTRIEDYLKTKGRKIIGWDEILKGGVSQSATIMSWRGTEGGRDAARLGHDVIMTPRNYMYFDYYQTADTSDEPLAIGGCVPLEKVYSFDPELPDLTPEEHKHILGIQANLWTEYISTPEYAEYMVLPRAAALSEIQWVRPENKDWDSFTERLGSFVRFYDAGGYNYARHLLGK